MSGTEESHNREETLLLLEEVFDRQRPIRAVEALSKCLSRRPSMDVDLARTALGLDTNILLTVSNHRNSSDVLDYLAKHSAPLVLPGQAVQEFWNNAYNGITTLDKTLKQRFESLTREARKVQLDFDDFEVRFTELLTEFEVSFGYVYDEATKHRIENTVEILRNSAITEFVPRSRFRDIASDRNLTKTPPGFKDSGNGDFYIWADFLYALLLHRSPLALFDQVVFITNDVKADWSIRGTPHPILCAEVEALLDVNFDVWTLDHFALKVGEAT